MRSSGRGEVERRLPPRLPCAMTCFGSLQREPSIEDSEPPEGGLLFG